MDQHWDQALVDLLGDLTGVQGDLLALLAEKRKHLRAADSTSLAALQPREQALAARLQACHDRRANLLKQAANEGLPSSSLTALAGVVEGDVRPQIQQQLSQAAQRAKLLQHQSLTQWVLVQRSLLHLSQMLEIIATGGQPRPTYGKEDPAGATGTLVDHAA